MNHNNVFFLVWQETSCVFVCNCLYKKKLHIISMRNNHRQMQWFFSTRLFVLFTIFFYHIFTHIFISSIQHGEKKGTNDASFSAFVLCQMQTVIVLHLYVKKKCFVCPICYNFTCNS